MTLTRLTPLPQPRVRLDADDESEQMCFNCGDWWPCTPEFWERRRGGAGNTLLDVVCRACRHEIRYAYRRQHHTA